MNSKILITGETGYIGSHTAVELMQSGHHVVIVDNLCNRSLKVLERLEALDGKNFTFFEADLRDLTTLDKIFRERYTRLHTFCGVEGGR